MFGGNLPKWAITLFIVVWMGIGTAPTSDCRAEGPSGTVERHFKSPQDVVIAFRRAHAKKDWRTCFLCLTPKARGWALKSLALRRG